MRGGMTRVRVEAEPRSRQDVLAELERFEEAHGEEKEKGRRRRAA